MDELGSNRDDESEQFPPVRARTVGALFVVLGAGICALATVWFTSMVRSPAMTSLKTGDGGAAPIASPPAPIPTPVPGTERRILEALAKPFPAASRPPGKVTFQEAIGRIAKLLPVPVDLDSRALDDANFNREVEVAFPAGTRTVGDVLDFLLSSAAPYPLDWVVAHGSLMITTVDTAIELTEMRVYDVTDLTEPVVTSNGVETWDSDQLMDAIRTSSSMLANGEDNLSILNVDGRTLLVARVQRKAHHELVRALTEIRALAYAPSQSLPSAHRRRVVQAAKPNAVSPKIATEADVAALRGLMAPVSDSAARAADSSCNAFALDLFRQLRATAPGNIAVCPFGLYIALALLKEGASGEAEAEIAHVLHATQSTDDIRASLRGLSNRLGAINLIPDYELLIQNRVWYDNSMPVPQALTATLRNHYHVEMDSAPFLTQPGDAEALINNWVKNATKGRIDEIISAREIGAGKVDLAITNAVLFRGLWDKPFNRKKTVQAPFHAAGQTFDVSLMRGEQETALLGEFYAVQILERLYRGGLLSALILLPPNSPGALERLEASLSVETLKQYRDAMGESLVKVELPRFEIESDFRLEEPLKAMGAPRAFVPTSDFSKLGRSNWKLAFVRQKSRLRMNEEGTEAVAASGMLGAGTAEEHLFRADRPFLFLIQEKSTGLILFVARVTDPNGGTRQLSVN